MSLLFDCEETSTKTYAYSAIGESEFDYEVLESLFGRRNLLKIDEFTMDYSEVLSREKGSLKFYDEFSLFILGC